MRNMSKEEQETIKIETMFYHRRDQKHSKFLSKNELYQCQRSMFKPLNAYKAIHIGQDKYETI